MRLAALLLALACITGASTAAASAGRATAPVQVTFVGDSVSASISYAAAARAQLRRWSRRAARFRAAAGPH